MGLEQSSLPGLPDPGQEDLSVVSVQLGHWVHRRDAENAEKKGIENAVAGRS
jgi:hypothetical protein